MTDMVFILGNPILCVFREQALNCTQARDASSNNIVGNSNEKKHVFSPKYALNMHLIINKSYLANLIHFPRCTTFR